MDTGTNIVLHILGLFVVLFLFVKNDSELKKLLKVDTAIPKKNGRQTNIETLLRTLRIFFNVNFDFLNKVEMGSMGVAYYERTENKITISDESRFVNSYVWFAIIAHEFGHSRQANILVADRISILGLRIFPLTAIFLSGFVKSEIIGVLFIAFLLCTIYIIYLELSASIIGMRFLNKTFALKPAIKYKIFIFLSRAFASHLAMPLIYLIFLTLPQ